MVFDIEKIKDYARKQYKKGFDSQAIKKVLLIVGVPEELVDQALAEVEEERLKKFERREKKREEKKRKKELVKEKRAKARKRKKRGEAIEEKKRILKKKVKPIKKGIAKIGERAARPKTRKALKITAIILIIAAFLSVAVLSFLPMKCNFDECFIEQANKCKAATYTKSIEGTTFRLETKDCLLTKTIVNMGLDEPEEIKEEFLGKSMVCSYVEGDFSPLYLTTISGMINNCEGELRDALLLYIA